MLFFKWSRRISPDWSSCIELCNNAFDANTDKRMHVLLVPPWLIENQGHSFGGALTIPQAFYPSIFKFSLFHKKVIHIEYLSIPEAVQRFDHARGTHTSCFLPTEMYASDACELI